MSGSDREESATHAHRLHRSQVRALLSAAALLALLSGEPESIEAMESDSAPTASAPAPAPSSEALRTWLVDQLQVRNPRLGTSRSERIADAVLRCTTTQNMPELTPQLMLAVMLRESDARPGVTSPKGAVGLMQVMPYVYHDLLDLPGSIGHLESNVEAGCLVLADNIRRLGLRKGISSYFWGNAIVSDRYVNGVESILRNLQNQGPAESRG